ncbi:hypothetical protein V8C42DRAFT_326615 [Trichoderma barbatum]
MCAFWYLFSLSIEVCAFGVCLLCCRLLNPLDSSETGCFWMRVASLHSYSTDKCHSEMQKKEFLIYQALLLSTTIISFFQYMA